MPLLVLLLTPAYRGMDLLSTYIVKLAFLILFYEYSGYEKRIVKLQAVACLSKQVYATEIGKPWLFFRKFLHFTYRNLTQ